MKPHLRAFWSSFTAAAVAVLPLVATKANAAVVTWQGDIIVLGYPWANTVWGEPGNWDLGRTPTRADSAAISGNKEIRVLTGTLPWGTTVIGGAVGSINMIGDATGVPSMLIEGNSSLQVDAGYISRLTLRGELASGTGGGLKIGELSFLAGTMGGSGTTIVQSLTGGGWIRDDRALEIVGPAPAIAAGFRLFDNACITNRATMSFADSGSVISNGGNWTGGGAFNPNRRFDNLGSLIFEPAPVAGSASLEIGTFFFNNGSVEVRQGGAALAASFRVVGFDGTHTGSFLGGLNTEMEFWKNQSFTSASRIESLGKVRFLNGSSSVSGPYRAAQTEVVNADVTFAGRVDPMGDLSLGPHAILRFNTGAPISLGTVSLSAGGIGGNDTINIAGPLVFSSGWVNGSPVNANGGIEFNLDPGGRYIEILGTLNNPAAANWNGGTLALAGTFNNLVGATFDAKGDDRVLGGTFNNAGTFRKSGGSSLGETVIAGAFNNAGVVDVQTGTLRLHGGGTHSGGSLTARPGAIIGLLGTHTVAGSLSSSGTLGASQHPGAWLVVEAGASFSHLSGSFFIGVTNRGSFDNRADLAASNLKCNTHQRKVRTWIRRRSTASFSPRTG